LSSLIVDEWRRGFSSQADFDARVPEGTAIHHGCQDESIYTFLRSRILRKEGGEIQPAQRVETPEPEEPPATNPDPPKPKLESFQTGMDERLDWIMQQIGTRPDKRAAFYAALKARGIEAGRKKRALQKASAMP
jgi:hypothetical protein